MRKTDIIGKRLFLDADAIAHFCKGGGLGYLKFLFRGQLYIVSDVEEELAGNRLDPHYAEVIQSIQSGLFIRFELPQDTTIQNEYSRLRHLRTAGEAACLTIGRFIKGAVIVTNLPCLLLYCQKWRIQVSDTVGVLKFAYQEGILVETDVIDFVRKVRKNGGKITTHSLQQLPFTELSMPFWQL